MIRRSWYLVAAVAFFATAPLAAQQPAAPAPVAAHQVSHAAAGGPRLEPGFHSYQPAVAQHDAAPAMAAAADRTVITISTLGLVLLGVLLIILLT
jgi:hypothetical protein